MNDEHPELDEVELAELRAAQAREENERKMQQQSGTFEGGQGNEGGRMFSAMEEGGSSAEDRVGKLRRITQIPMSFVLERLQLKLDSSELLIDLVIYIPFLIMFVFFFMTNMDTENNYYAMRGLRTQFESTNFPRDAFKMAMLRSQVAQNLRLWVELDKDYSGVGNQGDWAPLLTDAIIQTAWSCDRKSNIAPNSTRTGRGQNLYIGALRARTIRARPDSCSVDGDVYPSNGSLFPRTCYAIGSTAKVEDTNATFCPMVVDGKGDPLFKYYPSTSVPGLPTVGIEGVYHSGGYIFQIPFSLSCNDAQAIASAATGNADCGFCDQWASRFVALEWFVYSPSTDSFHSLKYFQEVDTAGWWRLGFALKTFQIYSPTQQSQLIFDIFFLFFVLYYWAVWIYGCVKAKRENQFLAYLVEMWNVLELANLVCFAVVFGLLFAWVAQSKSADVKFPFKDEYPAHLDNLQYLYYTQLVANSVNTLLTFLKLLKYVRLNAQLGVLTRTLAVCQQSIAGVLVLFVLIVVSYAIAGWALFGINMEEYCTLANAVSASFRLLVGDSNYGDLRLTNRFLAGAYFWSFLILGLFLLLNFIIAIISDSFAKISGRALDTSMEEMVLRSYQNMKAFLRPDNIKRIAKGIVNGNSEPKLIQELMEQLKARKALEEDVLTKERDELRRQAKEGADGNRRYEYDPILDDDDAEIVVLMKHEDIENWIDPTTYHLLSSHFFDYTWDEIMNDYDDAKKTSEEEDKRLMFDKVQEGVKKVVVEELSKVEELDSVLTSLEEQVRDMIDAAKK